MARRERYLPNEIIEIILLKLHVKLLLMFQTLSKSYMSMIRNPSFIRTYLEQSRNSNMQNSFLVCPKYKGYHCLAKFEDQKFRPEKEVPVSSDICSLCSCDDIIPFRRITPCRNHEYLLWNPINNTHRVIQYPFDEIPWNYGLCHDQTEDDYKIVLVFIGSYEVHSCKHSTWTKRKKKLSRDLNGIFPGVFVDRRLYFISTAAPMWGIIYFDPASDGLTELEAPEDIRYDHPFLMNMRGRVCSGGDSRAERAIQVWALRGCGSWEKTICIDKWSNSLDGLRLVCWDCYVIEDQIVIYTQYEHYIINTLEDRIVRYRRTRLEDLETPPRALVPSLANFLTPA